MPDANLRTWRPNGPSANPEQIQWPGNGERPVRLVARRLCGIERAFTWPLAVLILLIGMSLSERAEGASPPFIDLSGDWAFRTDPNDLGIKENWAGPEFDDGKWQRIPVPGTWESQGVTQSYPDMPCPELSARLKEAGIANAYNGVAWYRRWIEIPVDWQGKDLELLVGGVDDQDWTYLNGREIGRTGQGVPRPSTLPRRYTLPHGLIAPGRNLLAIRVYDGGGPGGIHRGPVVLLPKGALQRVAEASRRKKMEETTLRGRFKSPPNDRRILKIIHSFPQGPASHETFLLNLACQGFGGVVCNVQFEQYLESEENWQSFIHAVRMAKQLGMALWLYDEKGYPSGTAGGLTMQGHPEWEALGLLAVNVPAEKGTATVTLPDGPVLLARAYPVRDNMLDTKAGVDLSGQISNDSIRWEVPDGQWRLIAFVQQPLYEGTHAVYNLCEARHYINLLMREPTARFIELTHQRYADHLPDLSALFEATFTDEPSLMSVFGREGGEYPAIPWSPGFAAEFKKMKGYDLLPLLAALVTDIGPQTGKVRCDFWDTAGKLVAENFFGQIRDWCRKHGIPSGGHLLAEEDILAHCAYYGNFFSCVRNLDAPSIDCLTSIPRTVPWHVAKLIGSIANIEDRPITMCETSDHVQQYRRPGDEREKYVVSADEIRGTLNRLYVGGINTITSYYRWQDISTAQLRDLNEYAGRLGVMLGGGRLVCDTAVYYPIESVWAHYVPSRQGLTRDADARRIAKMFRELSYRLFEARRDFSYVDAAALRPAEVSGDALQVGEAAFRVLILPCVDTIPIEVWRKIAEFHANGGAVLAVGAIPRNSTEAFPCEETIRLSRQIFGEPGAAQLLSHPSQNNGVGIYLSLDYARLISKVLDHVIEPDFSVEDGESPLRYTHRRTEGKDIYFVINDSAKMVEEVVGTCAKGQAEIWNPRNGGIAPYVADQPLALEPYSGVFIVCEGCRKPRRLPAASLSEVLKIEVLPIEKAVGASLTFEPQVPEHVSCSVTAERGGLVRVQSMVKEGERDCWTFPKAVFPAPVDLSKFGGLSFRSHVPAGQGYCGAELMVILTEGSGVSYLARTGRSLNTAGWCSSTVWFDAFHVLGRQRDPNDQLDLGEIKAISIGWGGYHPRTGEKIVYTISDIKLLSLQEQTVGLQ